MKPPHFFSFGSDYGKENNLDNFLFQLYGLIDLDFSNLGQCDGRRALIYLLGDNNNAIVAADILIYLIYQTYTTPQDLLEQYNGFIERPYKQIELYTGCSNLRKHQIPLDLLKEEGLIETNNKGLHRWTCFKVNTETLIEKLDEAYIAVGKMRDNFWDNYKKRKNNKTEYNDPVDWGSVNDLLFNADHGVDYFKKRGITIFDVEMMFYVQKCWKETYGTDYKWSRGEFNTLSQYLTSKGVKTLTKEDVERLRDAIKTLDEVDWLTKAYTARKIIFRMNGYKKFKN